MSGVARRIAHAELLRLRANRSTAGLVLAAVVVTVAFVAVAAGVADRADLRGASCARDVLSVGGATAYPVSFVLGVLGMAGALRHGSIVRSVLAVPARWPIVATTAVVHAVLGLALGLAAFLLALAVGAPVASHRDAAFDLGGGLAWKMALGAALAAAVYGALGVAVAAIVRSRTAALVGGLVWIFVLDIATGAVTSGVGKLLPGGAATSLLRAGGGSDRLSMATSVLVLLGYGVVLVAVASVVLTRRRRLQ
jgi:hypothetical protein